MNEKWYNLIEDYNLGKLAPAELEAFEAALATDKDLAAAVSAHRTEWELHELMAENLLRAQIRQEFAAKTPVPWWKRNWKWLLVALAAAGIVAVLIFYKTPATTGQMPEMTPVPVGPANQVAPTDTAPVSVPTDRPAPKNVDSELRTYAMAAYETPESLSGLRSAATDDTLGMAQQAFQSKNYRRVIQLLAVLPQDERQEALLLRAHAQFEAGRFEAARQDFSELEKAGVYRREAKWFGILSAMAFSSSSDTAWRTALDDIRKDDKHPYHEQAGILWEKLRRQ